MHKRKYREISIPTAQSSAPSKAQNASYNDVRKRNEHIIVTNLQIS